MQKSPLKNKLLKGLFCILIHTSVRLCVKKPWNKIFQGTINTNHFLLSSELHRLLDVIIGFGITPNHAFRLADYTAGRDSHPALKSIKLFFIIALNKRVSRSKIIFFNLLLFCDGHFSCLILVIMVNGIPVFIVNPHNITHYCNPLDILPVHIPTKQ